MLTAGRYRLHDVIGRGAMGEVWRAYDEMLGRPVAVKLLLAQDSDPTAAARFRLEAQTAGLLSHPHVVGVLDFGEHEGRLFLVMELVEGDSLARVFTAAGKLPAEEVARIAAQAAAGLAAAHEQGIVHRDIKPGNLLLDAGGALKIGDFGIARFVNDPGAALTATGQIVGTSLYLSPERALGKPAGPAADIYALGCVLYQLLTGRPPFEADTAIAILHQHLDTAPVPPRELGVDLPPAFENYLLSLLSKRPEDRPTARQAAEWFAAGSWLGRPEPLPAASVPAPVTRPRPEAGATAEGTATTYAFPSRLGGTAPAHRTRRRRRPGVRAFVAHRPQAAKAAAAAFVFVAALLVGMALFSPEHSSAEAPSTDPPQTTSPLPSSQPSGPPATPSAPTALPVGGEENANGRHDEEDDQARSEPDAKKGKDDKKRQAKDDED
ncbi:protein kinase [Streptomyces sp. KM273126]|uniref:serine/threonine-protein kinase n=1 Tax=Streptomyces sp. KM273126 TaxID=2545247 RepID=UPI0015EB3165|nr:serine/threonine-protein kinase [Streptomyces sp. KM273126]MBA2813832.1 protein kinase [Streptomyces sp. KM273126]